MINTPNIILSIAGSDSGAGAGIQADIKSAAACGVYCATAITAITSQNTLGVTHIEPVSTLSVEKQIRAVMDDMHVTSIKSGMLYSKDIARLVVKMIKEYGIKNYVLDPVMVSTSGHNLIEKDTAYYIIDELLPLATLITPNIPECELISGVEIRSTDDFEEAAEKIKKLACKNLLLKGGHLSNDILTDYLFEFDSNTLSKFCFKRIDTPNTHGTGCSLSAAVSAYLSQGNSLYESVNKAEIYLHEAIEAGITTRYGAGNGAINHFYRFIQ